ncbi:MAG: ATP-dependent DNA helicase [Clostridia bacterium]|nr:ATP-dependent DNA helicase [Clostridia bacterium]
MAEIHVVSVRALAEYACASGSISYGAMMAARMREGREGHLAIQNLLPPEWQAEAPVSLDVRLGGVDIRVQGRADALCIEGNCVQIAEIKTTRGNPYEICQDDYPVHWAQAEIYGHLFCETHDLDSAALTLIYAGTKGGRHQFKREFTRAELAQRFRNYALPYISYLLAEAKWKESSEPTLLDLKFPFENFRDGQRDMADFILQAMDTSRRTLIEAPTGIGKTAASLYGALKALGAGKITSIFYLTARTTGRRAAENALQLMRQQGLKIRSVTITAKEKVCFLGKPECGGCRYGEGYYDRRREALRIAMQREVFGPEEIEELAREFEICPFELSLDLTEIADVIICDYNYVFDPRVRLKRHFDKKNRAGLLIDEAHNLPDRAREMYSATLSGAAVEQLRSRIAATFGDQDILCRHITALLEALTVEDAEYDARSDVPENIALAAAAFAEQAEKLRVSDEATVELMLECGWFARVARRFDSDSFRALIRPEEKGRIEVKLWCFAPQKYIDRLFSRVGGAALFSATLAPIDFYAKLLAVPDKELWLSLESPFPRENLFAARIPVSVKYRDRQQSMEQVACVIHAMAAAHPGNYLAVFPSHAYLMQAFKYYRMRFPGEHAIAQESRMSEKQRRDFIARFEAGRQQSMVAFIVLGGVFAEGVDLPDDRLSGAAIISTGIPQPNPESELLRELYDDGFEGGTDAAYTYPGFRRVLQAAGRVIRTETDRGVVLLLDQRYAAEKYLELMPSHWQLQKIASMSKLNSKLNHFWKDEK